MQTRFAPPERLPREEVAAVSLRLRDHVLLPWLDAVPLSVIVVNEHRQIVFCNQAFVTLAQRGDSRDIVGLRPGEALGCLHSKEEEAGCGCSTFCSVCGAARAILHSLRGEEDCQICRMLRQMEDGEAPLDLEVHTRPIAFEGRPFVLFTALDISHEKRLRYQERSFFHDLINLSGGMHSLTQALDMQALDEQSAALFQDCARRILREVLYHRDLTAAELGRLAVNSGHIEALPFLTGLASDCLEGTQPAKPQVRVDCSCGSFVSDRRLLGHVLRNMLRNAVEACAADSDEVVLSCAAQDGRVLFTVTNPGTIPPNVCKQLFKRYASTKGEDRGLGTYVMRLLGEHYLGGTLTFRTGPDHTSFTLRL